MMDDTQLLLNFMDVTILSCRTALALSAPVKIDSFHRNAKKSYGCALRYAGKLFFTDSDVNAFEFRSIDLENLISQLAAKDSLPSSRFSSPSSAQTRRQALLSHF
jgi:hypothetical protein